MTVAKMRELTLSFIGLGLHSEEGISIRGLEEAKKADVVYAELYTSAMPAFSMKRLEEIIGKRIRVVDRSFLEGEGAKEIITNAQSANVVLLVPGDPMIATTHVTLRIEAKRQGVRTKVVHGTSILSAAIGLSGLHNYKFGKSVTITFAKSDVPYDVIKRNREMGLHTLVFLDIDAERRRYMTVKEGLERLMSIEKLKGEEVITPSTLVVGLARVGSEDSVVKAGAVNQITNYDFGKTPHLLIVPDKLHFVEAEALVELCGAPKGVVDDYVRG